MIQKAGLRIVRAECRNLTVNEAIRLYHNHVGAPYFIDLLESVGKLVCVFILCGENAVAHWRQLMGATSPIAAASNTIRHWYGNHEPGMTHENAVHGSDSGVAATREIDLFFPKFRGIGLDEVKSSANLS
jgi:nucleoside-diphosphate kinase